ncbi:hypothetical protein BS47DRAFT_346898 [Hydnum rufescens UP504]|uniref:dolichol kinase n=1 Tax=Hydnum rufescens UP504 TaxID=1448309 RepID=A0A9P6AK25_9AGAM|nr:hypothetical protein BS47DRAFT_346898 [Hydnum rufescens UP504]
MCRISRCIPLAWRAVHRFLSEFLDEKDSGSVILTGYAGPLWLESPSRLWDFAGVLVLGVVGKVPIETFKSNPSLEASVAGKCFGRHPCSYASGKTIEGSAAFAMSVFLCALLLQLCRVVEPFSVWCYFCAHAPRRYWRHSACRATTW